MELCSLTAIYLGPNYGGGNGNNGDLLQRIPCTYCYSQCPQPGSRPPPTHASPGDSWTLTGKSGSVSCGVTAPFSWVLVHKFLLCPPRIYFPVLGKFWQLYGGVNGDLCRGLMRYPCLVHPESLSLRQTTADPYLHRRPSNTRGEQRHFTGLAISRYPMYLLTAAPAPTILLGCLSPWTWGISSRPVQCSD